MSERLVSFKELEAWELLFGLEESRSGSARVVYDSWFNGLVLRLTWHSMPIEMKLRHLIAAREPLGWSWSWNFGTTETHREAVENLFTAPMSEVARHESFHLACDCLRIDHDARDRLKA